jgi:alpha-L-arabinofuranosidase
VTHLRYPGGSLSDYFDWRKAVGDTRQAQPNPFNKGQVEPSAFGPDEFIALCRKLNIPGYVTLNAGNRHAGDGGGMGEVLPRQKVQSDGVRSRQ